MRKNFLLALLGMAAMFAGCSQEDNLANQSTDKVTSFTVGVDEGVNTRASEPADKPTRYIMEVYEATTSVGAEQATQVVQSANTFNVTLKDGTDYTILFWADYSDGVFDATKLREVKIATGKVATKAAFAGVAQFKVGTDDASVYTAVTLKHAVAQVKFKETGTLTATPSKLTVKYPESYSLNVEGYATAKIDGAITHELTCNAATTGVIATDYIIASNTDSSPINIEATLDSEAKKEISNVPFRRDYTTTISGAYSDKYSATLTASCEADWGADKEVSLPEPAPVGPAVGEYYYKNGTHSANYQGTQENPCIGIVIDIERGLILSDRLSGGKISWATQAGGNVPTNTTNADGREDVKLLKAISSDLSQYPAAKACENYNVGGTGWYLPSLTEAKLLGNSSESAAKWKTILTAANFTDNTGEYFWTTTDEADDDGNYAFVMSWNNPPSTFNKYETDAYYMGYVRCVKRVTL